MKNIIKVWMLPALLVLSGIVHRVFSNYLWELSLPYGLQNVPGGICAFLLLVCSALLLRRFCDRRTIVKSAVIVVVYGLFVLVLQVVDSYNILPGSRLSPLISDVLRVPEYPFGYIISLLRQFLLQGDIWFWPCCALQKVLPLLLIFAGKKESNGVAFKSERNAIQTQA